VSDLTIPRQLRAPRADLLEIGFWVLSHFEKRTANNQFHKISERNATGGDLSLYTTAQLREALNTFVLLIILLRTCLAPIYLNRIGSNPSEHTFGKARLRCRDVFTMGKMLTAFTSEALAAFANSFLEILASLCRRVSAGVDCEPWSMEDPSVIEVAPHLIAEAISQQVGLLPHGCLNPSLIDQLNRVTEFTCPTFTSPPGFSVYSHWFGHSPVPEVTSSRCGFERH
jgi:hypothetical protein